MTPAPTLYVVTGISFSGKSVLARALAEQVGAARVDPDKVAHEAGLGLAGEQLSGDQWRGIHTEAQDRVARWLAAGRSAVYDTVLFDRAQRDELRQLATRHGARTVLVLADTPRALAEQRWARNTHTRERFSVHPDDFALCADAFVAPGADEPHLRFRPDDDLTAWLRQHVGAA